MKGFFMSMRGISVVAFALLGIVAVAAEERSDFRLPVEPVVPAEDLIVERDRITDDVLRALPLDSAEPLFRPDDSVHAEAPLRGPLADRLFPALPWSSDPPSNAFAGLDLRGPVADRLFEAIPWAVDPAPAAPQTAPVDLAIKDMVLGAKPDRKLGKSEIRQIAQHYEARGYKPLWHEGAARSAAAEAALSVLRSAEEDGLDIETYSAPAPSSDNPEEVAAADIALTRALVNYARDASGARILNPARLSQMIDAKPDVPVVEAILTTLESAEDIAAALRGYNPSHPGYIALRKALAELRANAEEKPADLVKAGKTLRLGESDERVAQLRRRLGVPSDSDDTYFDEILAEAVKDFQRAQGIRATGILNQVTTAALNGEPITGTLATAPLTVTEADIISNMERWRWLPRDLGYNHIEVNIPEFQLRIIENQAVTHQTRIVVGKPQSQTPIFSDEVEFVIVNPTWTVPPSILLKEYLPKLRDNPYAMQNKGFEIIRNGRSVDPASIDWYNPPRDVAVRQPPGERNALGFIKFMFPNGHAVYLHDTPQKKYFEQDVRAESHGCVRVEDPFALAEVVLGDGWPQERIERLIGGQRERKITLARHMPVHLSYFTVTADSAGKAVKFRDVYGHDARVKKALGL
jgi:L,D-transpeptidase YcbB